jgi:transglutaminase-like putative cysteine protease
VTPRSSALLHSEQMTKVPVMPDTDASTQAQLESGSGERELFDRVAPQSATQNYPVFRATWRAINIFLLVSLLVAAYALLWELSTRRYLQGFSDAIVPTTASPQEKVFAILQWMSHGPARRSEGPVSDQPDRDPTDTLNYANLLKVCGSATNAFLNLADSSGLTARRLLLLDSHRTTSHVVAEVLIDGRWIVVDPSFHAIPRGPDGEFLTQKQLADPAVFSAATRDIPGYSPSYNFAFTSHVRLAHIPLVGRLLRRLTNKYFSQVEGKPLVSLVLERESLAASILALGLVTFLALVRWGARYYGETRLGIPLVRFRQQLQNGCRAFLQTTA